jgi:hypothetical protein
MRGLGDKDSNEERSLYGQGSGIRPVFMEMGRAADSARDPKLPAAVGTASGIRPILAADVAAYRVRARFCSEVGGRADNWDPPHQWLVRSK